MTSKRKLITEEIQNSILYLASIISEIEKHYFVFITHQIPDCIYVDLDNSFCCNWECDTNVIPCDKLISINDKERHFYIIISKCIDHILSKHNKK